MSKKYYLGWLYHSCTLQCYRSFIPVSLTATPDWFVEFILKNNNKIITGGEYGIDCSLINIIAYLIIIIAIIAIVHKNGSTLHDIWSKNHSNDIS